MKKINEMNEIKEVKEQKRLNINSEFSSSMTLSVSKGNSKMGNIPSVSLPPVVTCREGAPCVRGCYAKRLMRYDNVNNSYYNNLILCMNDRNRYFRELSGNLTINRFFRLHVSGDIIDADYFDRVVEVVKMNPHCNVLLFTKKFEIINKYIDNFGDLPENLKIILSNWGDWKCENPHGLPVTEVIFEGDEVPENWKICGGNCFNCACRGVGCWELKKGDVLAFYKH